MNTETIILDVHGCFRFLVSLSLSLYLYIYIYIYLYLWISINSIDKVFDKRSEVEFLFTQKIDWCLVETFLKKKKKLWILLSCLQSR